MHHPTSAPPLFERAFRTGDPLFVSGQLPVTDEGVRCPGLVGRDVEASRLVLDELGDRGWHARIALGVAAPPLGACVETEMVVEC